jgi:hypothetical protein
MRREAREFATPNNTIPYPRELVVKIGAQVICDYARSRQS